MKEDDAKNKAFAQYETIVQIIAAIDCDHDRLEEAEEAGRDKALSVLVRSGWVTPGEELDAEEFEILLYTGGPAVRIVGELDHHREPCRAWIEYQDWGTPWVQYFDTDQEILLQYCNLFYFGG